MTIEDIKIWYSRIIRSRTMWFNFVVAIFASLEAVYSVLQPFVPGNTYAWLTVILTVGNAILRVITKEPLQAK